MNYQQPRPVPVPAPVVHATIVPSELDSTAQSHFAGHTEENGTSGYTSHITTDESSIGMGEIKTLQSQGYTVGLAKSLADVKRSFPLRIWVVDNSGSMQRDDGHQIIQRRVRARNDLKIVDCTREFNLSA
eukprot:879_1